jgi:hypothetical protein
LSIIGFWNQQVGGSFICASACRVELDGMASRQADQLTRMVGNDRQCASGQPTRKSSAPRKRGCPGGPGIAEQMMNTHINPMIQLIFLALAGTGAVLALACGIDGGALALAGVALAPGVRPSLPPVTERQEGAWHVYPLEGLLDLAYGDALGNPSLRRVVAREVKIGPGKVLLGAIDTLDGRYRGFRADRISLIADAETGETIARNILDWLVRRAEDQAKARRRG